MKKIVAMILCAVFLTGCASVPGLYESDDAVVRVISREFVQSPQGELAVRIVFEYTNKSDETTQFAKAVSIRMYQSGKVLSNASCTEDDDSITSETASVKQGETVQVAVYCYLIDNTDVKVEVTF